MIRRERDPGNANNIELRVFVIVGTWNVVGRSPTGSLAVDVDECMAESQGRTRYISIFQEIVPLTAKTVIGAEDPTEATNWNLLIGKTLNDKYGCPWSTPMIHPIKNEDYHYESISDSESSPSVSKQKEIHSWKMSDRDSIREAKWI
ncbi:type I inositol polyphosphate 5-phosphatase 4-like isoform X7 [Henckelia pumila]|uniref:type I inositol polyphosphate 5-phosphatase 4-like isoform X7 n=1 Tax=Henckelia pumila TaxID=405737 RepID=UPI003C6E1715